MGIKSDFGEGVSKSLAETSIIELYFGSALFKFIWVSTRQDLISFQVPA